MALEQAPTSSASGGSGLIGTVVADRYRIERVLGEGGMGVVYLAEHIHIRKRVAIKVLLPEWSKTPEVVARFEREAIAAAHVVHPHIAHATDFGRLADGAFFLVLEYIDGQSLREAITPGPMPEARALRITRGIVEAVCAAHAKGIIHRDLKPENVMLVKNGGEPDFVKVLDFGIAKVTAGDPNLPVLTRVGVVMGTPQYMSPEQALGQAVDVRSDLYSIGVILYEMLSGTCPFEGSPASLLRKQVLEPPPPIAPERMAELAKGSVAIVERLLAKDPAERFATASDLLAAIERVEGERRSSNVRVIAAAESAHKPAKASDNGANLTKRGPPLTLSGDPAHARPHMSKAQWVLLFITFGFVAAVGGAFLLSTLSSEDDASPAASARAPERPLGAPANSSSSGVPSRGEGDGGASVAHTATGAAAAVDAGDNKGSKAAPPKRRTGPGGIYIPPPKQWFK